MGAVDVVPLIPIRGATVEDCVRLSREIGAAIAQRYGIPVFLYEDSASSDARRNLADIRKGEFEGFSQKIRDPQWKPDFGPDAPHATAGVVAVGARAPLIAYNINLAILARSSSAPPDAFYFTFPQWAPLTLFPLGRANRFVISVS